MANLAAHSRAQYEVCCLFPYHNARGVQVAIGDAGKDGAVGDAEVLDTDDAAGGVNHGQRIIGGANAGSAAGVESTLSVVSDEAG